MAALRTQSFVRSHPQATFVLGKDDSTWSTVPNQRRSRHWSDAVQSNASALSKGIDTRLSDDRCAGQDAGITACLDTQGEAPALSPFHVTRRAG